MCVLAAANTYNGHVADADAIAKHVDEEVQAANGVLRKLVPLLMQRSVEHGLREVQFLARTGPYTPNQCRAHAICSESSDSRRHTLKLPRRPPLHQREAIIIAACACLFAHHNWLLVLSRIRIIICCQCQAGCLI